MKRVLGRQVPLAAAVEVQQLPALLQIEVPGKQVDGWRLAAGGEVREEPQARARARARTPGLHWRLLP